MIASETLDTCRKTSGSDVKIVISIMAEFPELGAHCAVVSCQLLDFLPFECDKCHKIFCLQHRSLESHNCEYKILTNIKKDDENTEPLIRHHCDFHQCISDSFVRIECNSCKHSFCLKHRLEEDHQCPAFLKRQRASQLKSSSQSVLLSDSIKITPKCTGRRSDKTSAQVALMKLKLKAKGDNSIPIDQRIYLQVFLPCDHPQREPKNCVYFFPKTMKIGKILDLLCDQEKLTNTNNASIGKKLRMFLRDEETILPTEESLTAIIEKNILINGDTVFLNYMSA